MSRSSCAAVLILAGCGAGAPRYENKVPPPLRRVGEPRPTEAVQLELGALPWWTAAGGPEGFILGLPATARPPTAGQAIGAVRSNDVAISDPIFEAIRCAWKIVPMGDARPCTGTRDEAIEESRDAIEEAHAQLRARAGDAGASVVGDVRCFADRERGTDGRLWCEGNAIHVEDGSRAPLATPRGVEIPTGEALVATRFVLHADASGGILGRVGYAGSSFGLRYRPLEIGLSVLDLSRDGTDRRRVALGATLLGRLALGGSRSDAIAGVTAMAVAGNGEVNPDFDGLYHGFVGLAYQTPWRLYSVAQPFVQLRLGAARGTGVATTPMLELHLGLSTPERR